MENVFRIKTKKVCEKEYTYMKKRLLPVLLALTLCLGLAVPAFAADALQNPQTATIILPEFPEFEITVDGIYDTYFKYEGEDSYVFMLIPTGAVITFNEDVSAIDNASVRNEGIISIDFKADEPFELDDYVAFEITKLSAEGKPVGIFFDCTDEAGLEPMKYSDGPFLPLSDLIKATPVAPVADAPSVWAAEKVMEAIELGLVPETLQEKYQQATTRAEFCALAVALYEAFTETEIEERVSFEDTDDVDVEKAAAIGVVNGVGENKFDPDASLTRDQAAAMLSRLADAIEQPIEAAEPTFADNDSFQEWAVGYIGQMQSTGIMTGVGENTFAPKDAYTREQSIITIMRLFDLVNAPADEAAE